jgi:tetratricopeptide (TPR) repeat protein
MGDYGKALECHMKALGLWQQNLPENHPDVAKSLCDIGWIYKEMGNCEKALEYFLKGKEIFIACLGNEHHYTRQCIKTIKALKKSLNK